MTSPLSIEEIQKITEADLVVLKDMIERELTHRHFQREKESLAATTQYKNRRVFLIFRPENKRSRPHSIITDVDVHEKEYEKVCRNMSETDLGSIQTVVAGIIRTEGLSETRNYELCLPAFDSIMGMRRVRAIVKELEQIDPKIDLAEISVRYPINNKMELARFAKLNMGQVRRSTYADCFETYSDDVTVYQIMIADHQGATPNSPQFRSDSVRQILLHQIEPSN